MSFFGYFFQCLLTIFNFSKTKLPSKTKSPNPSQFLFFPLCNAHQHYSFFSSSALQLTLHSATSLASQSQRYAKRTSLVLLSTADLSLFTHNMLAQRRAPDGDRRAGKSKVRLRASQNSPNLLTLSHLFQSPTPQTTSLSPSCPLLTHLSSPTPTQRLVQPTNPRSTIHRLHWSSQPKPVYLYKQQQSTRTNHYLHDNAVLFYKRRKCHKSWSSIAINFIHDGKAVEIPSRS